MKRVKVCYALFFISALVLSMVTLSSDSDMFWQMCLGKIIVTQHRLPLATDLTWLKSSQLSKFIDHEWLYEVILYLFSEMKFGLYIFKFITFGMLSYICYKLALGKRTTISLQVLIITMISFFMFFDYLQLRPYTYGVIFFALVLYIYEYRYDKYKWMLPVISILWINIHAGDAVLFPITGLLILLPRLIRLKIDNLESVRYKFKIVRNQLILLGICYACQLFNPNGVHALTYPFVNMADSTMLSSISEWQPVTIVSQNGLVAYFIICYTIICMLIQSKRTVDLSDFLLFGAYTVLALSHMRNIPFIFIVSLYLVSKYDMRFSESHMTLKTSHALFVGICTLIMSICTAGYLTYTQASPYESQPCSDIVDALKKQEANRLFVSYGNCGYIEYQTGYKCFVDERYTPYTKVIEDCFEISNCNDGYENLIYKKYKFDYMLVSSDEKLYKYVTSNKRFYVILADKDFALVKVK